MSASVQVFRKALSTNSTASAFSPTTSKLPTTTAKTTSASAGVFDLLDNALGLHVNSQGLSKFIQVLPYAVGSSNDTYDMRLWGWSKTNDATPVYIPQLLVELNVTVGNIDASAIEASALLADTIAIAKGDSNAAYISPANDLAASILVHLRGCQFIEFDFDKTGTPPTSMNAYWRVVDQS